MEDFSHKVSCLLPGVTGPINGKICEELKIAWIYEIKIM